MLNYKFNSKLVSTQKLLEELDLPISTLNFWKTQWRKKGNDCWEMGLRLIGNKALWDPIIFLEWIFENKLKNKPRDLMERAENKKLIAFIKRNASAESVELI
jgi:hypothetical protein|tara:strand:+ start:1297 stop:1602 length:306 start_codon:yes stop_codon:yes gene_type:complete